MEQKRTLWIVAAVGVFLLVVLGAALVLYSPQAKPFGTVPGSRERLDGTASNGWISLAPSNPIPQQHVTESAENANAETITSEVESSLENSNAENKNVELKADGLNIYAENANIYSKKTDLNGSIENAVVTNVLPSEKNVDSSKTTLNLIENEDSKNIKYEENKTTSIAKKEKSVEKKIDSPVKVKNAKVVQKSNSQITKTELKPVTKKAQNKTTSAVTKYWIQVTALTSRKAADAAREELGKNLITADVFTYTDSKNQLFYRVRVGPYSSKSEAEYWRTKIAMIDSFKNTQSYITNTVITD